VIEAVSKIFSESINRSKIPVRCLDGNGSQIQRSNVGRMSSCGGDAPFRKFTSVWFGSQATDGNVPVKGKERNL